MLRDVRLGSFNCHWEYEQRTHQVFEVINRLRRHAFQDHHLQFVVKVDYCTRKNYIKALGTSTNAHRNKHYSNLYSLLTAVRVTRRPIQSQWTREKREKRIQIHLRQIVRTLQGERNY